MYAAVRVGSNLLLYDEKVQQRNKILIGSMNQQNITTLELLIGRYVVYYTIFESKLAFPILMSGYDAILLRWYLK